MKTKNILTICLVSSAIAATSVKATQVAISNVPSNSAITSSSGVPINSGWVFIGGFNGLTPAEIGGFQSENAILPDSLIQLSDAFVQHYTSQLNFNLGVDGFFDNAFTGTRVGDPDPLLGLQLFAIITDTSTINDATQIAIVTNGDVYSQDDNIATANSFTANIENAGSFVLGGAAGGSVPVPGFGDVPSFQLAAVIPEPSAALLFAGSLTLLGFRRRRA